MGNTWIVIIGFIFIFFATTLGASVVFFFKGDISPKLHAFFLGLASGVMIAASVWSLLLPAIEQSQSVFGGWAFLPAVIGMFFGGIFLVLVDKVIPQKYTGEGIHKPMRLFLAVTLHNIPEGLAVGFAFGGAALLGDKAAYLSALGLAVGIGIQNFPEGLAIALPIKKTLNSRKCAFLWGTVSGLPEPFFAVLGYFLASWLKILQPWLLSFAAGAMLFVAAEDLIPDAKGEYKFPFGAWGVLIGFVLMMALDVALG